MKNEKEILEKLNESINLLSEIEKKVDRLKSSGVSLDDDDKLDYYEILINHISGQIVAYKYILNIV